MVSTNGLANTLGIVNTAADLLVKGNQISSKTGVGINRAARLARRADAAGSSITALSGQTTILSRAFVDESIIDEAIIPNLFRSIHEWYAAQCISALQLSQMVDEFRSVQEVLTVVQTGHNRRQRTLVDNIAAKRVGLESFLVKYTGQDDFGLESMQSALENTAPLSSSDMGRVTSVKPVSTSDHRIGPLGELYEIKLSNPKQKDSSITIPLFIQMQPSSIPADIAPRFIDMNVSPTLWQRWTQMSAGELTFWKDFVFQRDLAKRQRTIIKDPAKSEAFIDFLRTAAKKDKYALDDISDSLSSRQSANLANSVIVLSEETVIQAKADSGIDLHNKRDRDRYFKDTYSMIVVIVDALHQRVTVFFNGLDGSIDVPYNEFRPRDTKFDPKEFMTSLTAFSTNSVGRIR